MSLQDVLVFRSSYSRMFTMMASWSLPATTLAIVLSEKDHIDWCALALGLLAGIVFLLVWTAFLVYYFTVSISLCGFRCYNFWGIYHDALWADILMVKRFNLGGLHYLRVYTKNSRLPLWLPLFLSKMKTFQNLILQSAPDGNPLASYFQDDRT